MLQKLENELEMLDRHLTILQQVFENEPIGIVKISNETEYPHHKVRYSLRILEEAELIEPTSQGAVTTDKAAEFVDTAPDQLNEIIMKLEGMKKESSSPEQGLPN